MSNDPFTLDMFGNTALSSWPCARRHRLRSFSPDAANDDDPDPLPPAPAPALAIAAASARAPASGKLLSPRRPRLTFVLEGSRPCECCGDPCCRRHCQAGPAGDTKEQAQLIRFTGFGSGELANGMFRRPGELISGRAGTISAPRSRLRFPKQTMPCSPAAPNMPTLPRSSSFGRSGPVSRGLLARWPRLEPGIGTGLFRL